MTSQSPSEPEGLARLRETVARDLARISYGTKPWSPAHTHRGEPVLDVAIVGAGQGGLAASFALRRIGIHNAQVFDRAGRGGEGPWITFARMITLRTPKHVTGPDMGIPSLTAQSWFEARYGVQAWEELDKISRHDWQAYLDWLRDVLDLPVVNDHALVETAWDHGVLRLTFETSSGERVVRYARKLVLATGIDGGGAWHVPPEIASALSPDLYAHTHQTIDFERLRGKRIGVLGAGASAFDNAATALEAGAGRVDLCLRRRALPTVNPYRWMENAGFLAHFHALPDLLRWRFMRHIYDLNQPPPQDTFWRCRKHANFAFHTATPWENVRQVDGANGPEIAVDTPDGEMRFDFAIIGTGFVIDLTRRPETAGFASDVLLWRDHYTPEDGEENQLLGSHPYLGPDYQFQPRDGAAEPGMLGAIHNFTFAATPSMGLSGASISGMRFGVERLARGIARDLFVADGAAHLNSLLAYQVPELTSLEPPVEIMS
jgi:FAD-dependent urate hydroxylase